TRAAALDLRGHFAVVQFSSRCSTSACARIRHLQRREFSLILDLLLVGGRIAAFLLAGTALSVEKGVFTRPGRSH
ncbi:MAG: hypothetical protein Q9Q13_06330, partial [Acidobacteriota bacterium]|nr:hypothetical protein [Acidobacteriota bacterium]